MHSVIGQVLGQNYRVIEPIGAGAMGVVYVVEHITLKKRFAAKLLSSDLARHPEAIARFEMEAHAASQLDHENIVSVTDYGQTSDGHVFLIVELLRGKTLQARIDQGPLPLEETLAILFQVCEALSAAHVAGIVHRDMKPENIFLTQRPGGRPVVKVLDFGISKARESTLSDGRITKQGQVLGSPEYMSPEASRGDEVDTRADIYAVGIILYELLCGEVPFRHENYLKVLQMHASEAPPAARIARPDLPEAVERLLQRALEKDPARRHLTIEEFEAELVAAMPDIAQRALIQSQTPAHGYRIATTLSMATIPDEKLESVELPVSATVGWSQRPRPRASAPPTTMDSQRTGRKQMVFGLIGVLVAAVAAIAIVTMLYRLRSDRPSGPTVAVSPETPPSASRPAAAIPPIAARPAPASEISFQVTSAPSGALVLLDGERIGRTPVDKRLPAADRSGELEVQLRGYRVVNRPVRLDQDGQVELELERDPRRGSRGASLRPRGSRGGRSDRTRANKGSKEGPPPAELDIKEGR